MQLFLLLEKAVTVILIMAVLCLIYILYERFRQASDREMLSDRFIAYLEDVHQRTAPKEDDEPEIRDYRLAEKTVVRKIYYHNHKKS